MDASLSALSPVDGRYRAATEGLAQLLSEAGLTRERVRVEAMWVLELATTLPIPAARELSPEVRRRLESLATDPGEACAIAVKEIERRINHDVKAVEYFIRDELKAGWTRARPFVSPSNWPPIIGGSWTASASTPV